MTEPGEAAPDAYTQMAESRSEAAWIRIEPEPAYTPQIGALVQMMAYARLMTLHAARGLSTGELDAVPPGFSNSIGMLLAHIAATDRLYHIFCFQGVNPYATEEFAPYVGAMTFGQHGERVRGRSLDSLLADLEISRAATLAELARRDDAWLASEASGWGDFRPNHHWAWFHVMEDEVSHRGQMRLIRKAIKQANPA